MFLFMEDLFMAQTVFRKTAIISTLAMFCVNGIVWGDEPRDHTFVLTVRRMDCPAESAPAIADISKIPGVKSVGVDYKTVTLSIVPKRNAFPSPLAIWEVAERARIEPVKLQTAHGTYYSKPAR